MAVAHSEIAWQHTSALMAHMANLQRDPKKRRDPYKAAEFNPHLAKSDRSAPIVTSMRELKGLLMGNAASLEESRQQAELQG